MSLRVCSQPGCPELIPQGQGRCTAHTREADKARGTSAQRGYTSTGHRRFRTQVIAKHPICVICRKVKATVADHYPQSRRELIRLSLDPNDPQYGRGLCLICHSVETARHQPGGWNISPNA